MRLVNNLFKIVCATCPAHAVVHESVRYQDGLLIHYECHGKQYLAMMHPYITRVLTHKDGERCSYSFSVVKPDVSFLREPIDFIYVLDTELAGLDPARLAEMHQQLAERLPTAETSERPSIFSEDDWNELLAEGRKTLDLLTRFAGRE